MRNSSIAAMSPDHLSDTGFGERALGSEPQRRQTGQMMGFPYSEVAVEGNARLRAERRGTWAGFPFLRPEPCRGLSQCP